MCVCVSSSFLNTQLENKTWWGGIEELPTLLLTRVYTFSTLFLSLVTLPTFNGQQQSTLIILPPN
jgi:hypothetical protein